MNGPYLKVYLFHGVGGVQGVYLCIVIVDLPT